MKTTQGTSRFWIFAPLLIIFAPPFALCEVKAFEQISGASELRSKIAALRAKVPDLGRELEEASKQLKIQFQDNPLSELSAQKTGIPVSSNQTAVHYSDGTIIVNRKAYDSLRAKDPRGPLFFLTQEVIEQPLSKKKNLGIERLHAVARDFTEVLLNGGVDGDEKKLQTRIYESGIGYYATSSQIRAREQAEGSTPFRVRMNEGENLVFIQREPAHSLRRLSRTETGELRNYLSAENGHICSLIIEKLNDSFKNGKGTEVLALVAQKLDDATRVCLNHVQVGVAMILTDPAKSKTSVQNAANAEQNTAPLQAHSADDSSSR